MKIKNKIIIIDEAHNIKNIAKSSYSSKVLKQELEKVRELVLIEKN